MSEQNIGQEILDKIKNVKPRPRWQFLFKDYVIWFFASLALIISSLAFAVVLYMLIDNDWDVYARISGSLLEFIFSTLPYFWLIFLGVFIILAYYYFRHTKKGYKFSLAKVFLASLLINVLMGTLLYNVGVGQAIDDIVARRVPFYKELINRRQGIWSNIDDGFLGGVIVAIDDKSMDVEDLEGNIWTIQHFHTTTSAFMKLQPGDAVRIIGQKIDSQNFEMDILMPMRGMRWMQEGHRSIHMMDGMRGERNFLHMRSN